MQPTPEQATVIVAIPTSPNSLCIEAVAGSGKTATLVLAAQGIPPTSRTLALAFNSKTQIELERRLPAFIVSKTFNSLGMAAWRGFTRKTPKLNKLKVGSLVGAELEKVGIGRNHADSADLWDACRNLVDKAKVHGLVPSMQGWPVGLLEDTEDNWRAIADRFDIEVPLGRAGEERIRIARAALIESCKLALKGDIDFDDMLYMSVCWKASFEKYSIVLVDEAQDLSPIQHIMVERSCAYNGKVIAVGDPRQAIYGFRGASSDSMTRFKEKFSMDSLPLSYNFRCGSAIVDAARKYVPSIQSPPGQWQGTVVKLDDWSLNQLELDSTVLCRNLAPLVSLGFKLITKGIPANMFGRDLGQSLIKIVLKLEGSLLPALEDWKSSQIAKAKDPSKAERVQDNYDSLIGLIELSGAATSEQLINVLNKLFKAESGRILLSTIHRAKGLEWSKVYILDRWRMPSRHAVAAAKENPELYNWMLQQEDNLHYIAITRAKHNLTYINLHNCLEFKKKESQNV